MGHADPEVLKLRLLAWFLFSVFVSVVTLGAIAFQLWDSHQPLHQGMEVLSGGELIITSVVLTAASVGDVVVLLILTARLGNTRLRYPGLALTNIGGAIVFLIFGGLLYGSTAAKAREEALTAGRTTSNTSHGGAVVDPTLADHLTRLEHVAFLSLVAFGFALLFGTGSIWLNTQQTQKSEPAEEVRPWDGAGAKEGSL
nr:hypothetical protein [Mycobacterium sp. UM_NZ2]